MPARVGGLPENDLADLLDRAIESPAEQYASLLLAQDSTFRRGAGQDVWPVIH